MALNSKPFFPLPPSPSRYAEVALNVMQERGLEGDSEEFEAARQGPDGDEEGPSTAPTVERLALEDGDRSVLWATVPENDMTDDGVAYADALAGGLLEAAGEGTCGAVVDLRGNRGGDLGPMLAGLNPLLPDGELLGFEGPTVDGAAELDGGTATGGGTPTSTEHVGDIEGPVVVLTDEHTASSAEAVLLAFRAREDVHVIGQPTAGAPSANQVITMPDGSRLLITVAGDRDATGELHVDQPIAPDERTEPGAATDQAAEDWLAAHGCG